MPTLELETMRCELDGPLARLRLNRPEALNAANWAWVQDLVKATDYLAQSIETRVVIVSGECRTEHSRRQRRLVAALGPMRIARLIGAGPAKYLCLLGRRFTANEGFTLGLIHEVVALDDLEQRAVALAEELLTIPFTALRHTKRQIDRSFEQDYGTLMEEMVAAEEDCLRSPEHVAVMTAYLEARALGKKRGEGEQ